LEIQWTSAQHSLNSKYPTAIVGIQPKIKYSVFVKCGK
jgi:hypothetical protein